MMMTSHSLKFTARTLNKPVPAICVSYTHVEHMAFNGTVDPAFLLTIASSHIAA